MSPGNDHKQRKELQENSDLQETQNIHMQDNESSLSKKNEIDYKQMDAEYLYDEEGYTSSNSDYDESLDITKKFVFEWRIENYLEFAKLNSHGTHGPSHKAPFGHEWGLYLFPQGNKKKNSLSAYIEIRDPPAGHMWKFQLRHRITLVNHKIGADSQYPRHRVLRSSAHGDKFSPSNTDWGFDDIISVDSINEETGFLHSDGSLTIRATMIPVNDFRMETFDSKSRTGKVGLENQGATCYLNSLLQSLFMTKRLRKAVYELDSSNDISRKAVSLELQRLFWLLQTSNTAVSTRFLTTAFGWTNAILAAQHDVQEMNRELIDKLEERMKDTDQADIPKRLYTGKMISFIKCCNVEFESSRTEEFYDIQLDVKEMNGVYESFAKYTELERLSGDNQYEAENFGKQDADKGVSFLSFPPVLNLHLKRFEYDLQTSSTSKINSMYKFPSRLCLDRFIHHSVDRNGIPSYKYRLHAVLVHSGEVESGHYNVYINDLQSHNDYADKWLKFDDTFVTPVHRRQAVNSNFGRDNGTTASAYMLVYIQESELDYVLGEVSVEDIPKSLVERLEADEAQFCREEEENQRRRDILQVKYVTSEDVKQFKDYYPKNTWRNNADFVSDYMFKPIPIHKQESSVELYKLIAKTLELPVQDIRIWTIVDRQNATVRPDSIILPSDDISCHEVIEDRKRVFVDIVTSVADNHEDAQGTVEVKSDQNDETDEEKTSKRLRVDVFSWSNAWKSDNYLLLIRWFHPGTVDSPAHLTTMGHIFVPKSLIGEDVPNILVEKFSSEYPELKSYSQSGFVLWELETHYRVNLLEMDMTLEDSKLQNGDIIIFRVQKQEEVVPITTDPNYTSDPVVYMKYLGTRMTIKLVNFWETEIDNGYTVEVLTNQKFHEYFAAICDQLETVIGDGTGLCKKRLQLYCASNPFTNLFHAKPLHPLCSSVESNMGKIGQNSYMESPPGDIQTVLFYDFFPVETQFADFVYEVTVETKMLQNPQHVLLVTKHDSFEELEDDLHTQMKYNKDAGPVQWFVVKGQFAQLLHTGVNCLPPSRALSNVIRTREFSHMDYTIVADLPLNRKTEKVLSGKTGRPIVTLHFTCHAVERMTGAHIFGTPFVLECCEADSGRDVHDAVLKKLGNSLDSNDDPTDWKIAIFPSMPPGVQFQWLEDASTLGESGLYNNQEIVLGVYHKISNGHTEMMSRREERYLRAPTIASSGIER